MLHRDNTPYLSPDTIVSPNNPRRYLPDSHFTDAVLDELARALVKIIESEDAKRPAKGSGRPMGTNRISIRRWQRSI